MWFVCIFLKQTSSALLSNHCAFPASLLPKSKGFLPGSNSTFPLAYQENIYHQNELFLANYNFAMIKETVCFATDMRDDINLRQGFPKTEVSLCRWQPDHSNMHHETCKMLLERSPKHHRYCLLFNKNGKIKII